MASAQGVRAGKAYVEIGTDSGPFVRGLNAARAQLLKFGQAIRLQGAMMAGAGAAIAAPLAVAVRAFTQTGSQLFDLSARTGLSVEALSEIGYAAKQSGTDLGAVEIAVRKMQVSLTDAASGAKAPSDALERLGLTIASLASLSPDRQFSAIGERLAEIRDPAIRAATAVDLFGRSGTRLLPMLGQLGELRAEAQRLGVVMSTGDAAAADRLGDSLDSLKAVVGAVQNAVGRALSDALTNVVNRLTLAASAAASFTREHGELVKAAGAMAAALVGMGTAVTAVGFVFTTGLGPGLKLAATAIGMLTSPIALIAAGAAAAGAALLYFGVKGDTLGEKLNTLSSAVAPFMVKAAEIIRAAWTATADALSRAWKAMVEYLAPILNAFGQMASTVFNAIYEAVSPVVQATADAIRVAWDWVEPTIGPVLTWLREAIIDTFASVSFAVGHWRDLFDYALVGAAYNVVKFGAGMEYVYTEVIPEAMSWFAKHWKEVFTDILTGTQVILSNLWTNISNLWTAIQDLFAGKAWDFTWQPLLSGFESAITELPQIAAREIGALEGELKSEMEALGNDVKDEWEKFRAEFDAGLKPRKVVATEVATTQPAKPGAFEPVHVRATPDLGDLEKLRDEVQDSVSRIKLSSTAQFGGQFARMSLGVTSGWLDEQRKTNRHLETANERLQRIERNTEDGERFE